MNLRQTGLLTDLYQLTMLRGYFDRRMEETAVFEFFVRKLPRQRNFLIAAGLEQLVEFLENFRFELDELEWLAGNRQYPGDFIAWLGKLRFTGDLHAVPEGTIVFENEPIVRVTAPLPEAQVIETRLINLLQFQTMIASKAARSALVAPGKLLVDFGLRRAHGAEAGLLSARASYIAGFTGTATVLAAKLFGIPIFGTMAHSFIQAHPNETGAFRNFARSNPDNTVFLLDTYDTEAAAHKTVQLARELQNEGIRVKAVRLDSGDLIAHAKNVRAILDAGGLGEVRIFASGNLDEYELERLLSAGAPIDGFGIGTRMNTSHDEPSLECAYKMTEYAGQPRCKLSEGKITWPGRKQVFRSRAPGPVRFDILTVDDDPQDGEPLLTPVMHQGKRLFAPEALDQVRARAADQMRELPEELRRLEPAAARYEVRVSERLKKLADSAAAAARIQRDAD
jgi:nicotinate phosphoribosyltransferase